MSGCSRPRPRSAPAIWVSLRFRAPSGIGGPSNQDQARVGRGGRANRADSAFGGVSGGLSHLSDAGPTPPGLADGLSGAGTGPGASGLGSTDGPGSELRTRASGRVMLRPPTEGQATGHTVAPGPMTWGTLSHRTESRGGPRFPPRARGPPGRARFLRARPSGRSQIRTGGRGSRSRLDLRPVRRGIPGRAEPPRAAGLSQSRLVEIRRDHDGRRAPLRV